MLDAKIIGERLTKLRGGLSQTEVAAQLDVSRSAMAMYESGQRVPRDEIKIKLAQFYNTSIEAIFFAP